MKSKKMLAQIAAFSLVFGMTGVVSSWADDIILDGTTAKTYNDAISLVKNEDGSFTVNNQDVKGVWLQNGSKLTANNVHFIYGSKGNSEISVDNRSTLTVNGGSIDSDQDAFNVNDGSKAEVNHAKVTTGAWANNAAITLKNSTTSGNWLYAGNAFPDPEKENDNGPVKEGLPVGSITIDGGMASVKNVLVQNKGQFNVTNGAVLDVTKDTSATDSAWEQPATGIMKGGEIVVRAWGPNTAQAEKGNSDSDPINKLDQVSTLAVNGATVKANKLTVEGKVANDISYTEKAAFTAKNSTVEVKQATFNEYARGEIDNTKLNVNGDLTIKGNGTYDGNEWTFADTDGNVTVNDSAVNVTGKVAINGAKLYIAGHHSTTGSDEESLAAESEDKPSLKASDITLTNEAMLTTDNQAVVNADIVTVNSGTVLSVNGHSTLNVKHLKVSDTAKRVRVRGNFDGQVTDVNGNALRKEQVKKLFLLNPNDKTSLEFQDPEVDHTLVLHMNADGGLTMQGKDFSQSDTGNTRTYIMASWSANGDYNAEGHDIKNVNSLSANRLVINGTDITDSLGGAVDVSGKADTSLGNLTDEGKKVIRNTMKGDLDTKADAATVTEELAKKADAEAMTTALSQKAQASDLAQLQKGANIDKAAWQSSLGDGKNVAGNTGLITGDTLHQALQGISTTGTVYKAGKHITIDKDNTIMVNTDGKVTAGDTGIVTGGQVQEAISKATEGIATNANVSNKADKNLSNLSDAGKTVIKNTMMEELAGKADKSYVDAAVKKATEGVATDANVANKADKDLGNLSEAGKNVIKETMKDDLMGKADTSYVDEKVKDKVNTSDFTAIKDKVDAHETALADKADKSYVDAAVKKATEGVATDANVANKADKDLGNLSEAGKNVIKETMKDDLAAKADKTYVDDQLKNKVNTADFNKVKEQVDSNEKALATKADKKDLSDLSAKVDGKADKTYVDGALDKKANAADVYTKTDTDKKIEDSLTDVNKAVDGKADKADVEKLGQKVDQNVSELNANKADADASNIDAAAYTAKLNTGKVEDGNKGLVSGGAVWSAINEVKNNTGAGLVTVKDGTVTIASDADATKVSVAGKNGDRVLTGVKTDEKDASSAANVGYVNSTAVSLTDSMNAMNSKLSGDIKNAGAVGAALAGLHHLDYDPDNKLDVAVAAGNYRGKSATAMGLFYQPNEMMMVSAGATIGADDNAYNVGLSFKVGKGQTGLTTSKAAMSQEIKELKAAKEESDQKMVAQDEEIRALKEQVAMLVKEMKLSNTVEKDMKK
uniref:YadA-like family protein n=1 Tax=Dialister sp. TaxID=1955814 RepID=UPI003FEFD951